MIMNKKQQTDLTNGPIVQTLAKLALPIMASSFLGTAYNITDMAWIGVLGSKAVAGVGMGGMYGFPRGSALWPAWAVRSMWPKAADGEIQRQPGITPLRPFSLPVFLPFCFLQCA